MSELEYNDELERRIAQFRERLLTMQRRKAQGHVPSFIIFDDQPPEPAGGESHARTRGKKLTLAGGAAVAGWSLGAGEDLGDANGSADEARSKDANRFIQFAYDPKLFFMDLPNNTLFGQEIVRLMRDRRGFFRAADRPGFYNKDIQDRCAPVCKEYMHGDERCAAEDAAYIFFTLWHYPVDWRFYVTAFSRKANFEQGVAIS